jgi:hypothetical protein
VIRLKTCVFLLIANGLSSTVMGQNPPQGDAARLQVELAERARREEEQRDWETKIFPIRFVDPGELQRALSMFRGNISYSGGGLRVLSIRAPKEIMPAIEDAIKRLDVPAPRRSAELTIFVLVASDQADAAAASPPPGLQPVLNQLKNVLSYKNYQLIDTLIVHVTETRGSPAVLQGQIGTLGWYNFQTRFRIETPDGKTPTLRLNEMNFRFQPTGEREAIVAADVDIPQGQQVVVGKASMGNKALILVMTSKFSN